MENYKQIATRYFRGTIRAAEEKQLSAWLQDDGHRALFRQWEAEWRTVAKAEASDKTRAAWERLQSKAEGVRTIEYGIDGTNGKKDIRQKSPIRLVRPWYYAAAASVVLLFGVALWLLRPAGADEPFIAQTSVNETKTLTLTDGTEVTLAEQTSIACVADFGKSDRKVLFEGEALFSVAKDAERPFVISVGDYSVTVLGTEFNLRAYPQDSIYTLRLLSGKVKLKHKQDSVFVEPGEIARFDVRKQTFALRMEGCEIRLGELISRLERMYDVQITLADNALAQETVYISISTDDSFADVCAALEMLLPVDVEAEDDHYRIAAR